jgi:glycosyltransferase involved in cell wall biosynthesis
MDLFLFLSAYESFGNVIAEALLTGLPTLTSNVPVFEEIYGNEKDFILGNPNNFEEVKQKFLQVTEDFPRLARKAYDISASVETQCSIENHLRQIENVYEKY